MKGHIRQRSPGHWAIVLDVRDAQTGERKRRWHSFTGNKTAAQAECRRLLGGMDGGTYLDPTKITVADFLERWLDYVQTQVSPSTFERYACLVRKNLVPLIGHILLRKLDAAAIAGAYSKALREGCQPGKRPLKARTVNHMHRILFQALQQALPSAWKLIAFNPAIGVKPPKVEAKAMNTYDMPQTAELIDAMRGTRMLAPMLLAVLCGLRRGEICALRWKNVDLATGQMAVVESAEQTAHAVRYKSPKSGKGRSVALTSTLIEELRQHRIRQAQELLKVGVRLSGDNFVVAQADGSPLQPRSLTHEWVRLIGKTSLPRVRFHDLRHAHATHLLKSGVHPKIASERLGHSKVGITLDLYSHVLPDMQGEAATIVDDALRAAIQKRETR